MGVVGILFGWVIGYLLCYRLVADHDLQSADRRTTVPLSDLLFADALPRCRRHSRWSAARVPHSSRRARRRGSIPSKSSGARHERSALQAVGLVRRIEGAISHTLVNGIDLSVNKGEFLAITGPSGSGKSSLLYLLGLLDAPTRGRDVHLRPADLETVGGRARRCTPHQMRLRLPVPLSAAGIHRAGKRAAADARLAGKMCEKEMQERGLGC